MQDTLALPVANPVYIKGNPKHLGKIARILGVEERPTVDLPGRWAPEEAPEADLYISQNGLASLRKEQPLVYEKDYYSNHQGPTRLISANELSEMCPPDKGPFGVDYDALKSIKPSKLTEVDARTFLSQLRRGHVDPKTLKISSEWTFGRLALVTAKRVMAAIANC